MNILDIAIKEVGGIPTLDKMLSIRDQVVRQWNKKGYISYGFQDGSRRQGSESPGAEITL
ncbi:hypothetical protein C5472_03590 [Photorhabdus sp. RW14-46]|nr:hypothetical protein [Photorhabdus sp. RW14-46]